MMQNLAAWMQKAGAQIEVAQAPAWTPEKGEVLVKVRRCERSLTPLFPAAFYVTDPTRRKVHSVSVQPVDWKGRRFRSSPRSDSRESHSRLRSLQIQDYGYFVKSYPFVLGSDVAGEVVQVGEGVNNLKDGDRVLGFSKALATGDSRHASFQKFSVVDALLTSQIPDSVSFNEAAVLPLALATAATSLYQSKHLDLPLPSADSPNRAGKGKVILVYGGSSSVGSAAIQLAAASGVAVVTTCSPANFDLVKSLGAAAAIDYRSDSAVQDAVKAIESAGTDFVGVCDAISEASTVERCAEIASKAFDGKGKLYIATTQPRPEKLEGGVQAGGVFALDVLTVDDAKVAKSIYLDFSPLALANGTLRAKPDPLVVGKGLGSIQEGINVQRKGVSAKKVVISDIQA
ncbi:hypothetical protein BMF94_4519 [Rhodotorula taiwanensis]|uniref:Enoyl reductase (ER) domain-containing protein n=1 Tax=Rhodotorula taiwanensis TaxID=741276 RepID=A0A2S5B7E0_9BASI|nr:hypothetical protein BMF94_4519 [Rhodotorula taiwanensis]